MDDLIGRLRILEETVAELSKRQGSTGGSTPTNTYFPKALFNEAPDGSRTVFTLVDGAYVAGKIWISKNGIALSQDDFTESDPTTGEVTFTTAPVTGTVLRGYFFQAGDTGIANAGTLEGKSVVGILSDAYPVGSIYISVVSTNPATLLGFGTWTAFATGRTLVGIDAEQTEFDTVEETGGAKTHTLTEAQMPSHTHTQNAHYHTARQPFLLATSPAPSYNGEAIVGAPPPRSSASVFTFAPEFNTGSTTATNQNTGEGQAHNNLQPYIVVYMWKRTA